jgi:hypothetical protein
MELPLLVGFSKKNATTGITTVAVIEAKKA